ncbi:TPA: head completion/stabilization protein, partial [Escherichia coli]
AGFTRLADVPADDIDGESIKVFYYERAVCAMATASLYERYRGVDASAKGVYRLERFCPGMQREIYR